MADFTPDELEHIAMLCPALSNKALRLRAQAAIPTVSAERIDYDGSWMIDGRPYFDNTLGFYAAMVALAGRQVLPREWSDAKNPSNALLTAVKGRMQVLRDSGFDALAEAFERIKCPGTLVFRPDPWTPRVIVSGKDFVGFSLDLKQ